MTAPLRVGILGGGQLALMLVEAAKRIGLRPYVFAASKTDCAVKVCDDISFDDGSLETLTKFCESVDVVTIENEFIDLNLLSEATESAQLFPQLSCLRLAQNKLDQKINLSQRNLSTLKFVPVKTKSDLLRAIEKFGDQLVLKRARLGYDGKGTFIFNKNRKLDPEAFWHEQRNNSIGSDFEGYAEPLADFEKELAVIVARSIDGQTFTFPVIETNQDGGVCHWAVTPTKLETSVETRVARVAVDIISAFDGIGVFGVEMFLLRDKSIVVNEIAPRVHNSGHLTMDGCNLSQFEIHLRAITGMDIEKPKVICPGIAMVNILGRGNMILRGDEDVPLRAPWKSLIDENKVWIHWYGKAGETKGRKLGHINVAASNAEVALKEALALRENILI